MTKTRIEKPDEVQKMFDEMLCENAHIKSIAQKALLTTWCRLLLHLKAMPMNRECLRWMSELRQLSKVLKLEPEKPSGAPTDLITLLQEADDDGD